MASAIVTVSLTDERYSWVAGNKYFVLGNLAISASPATYKAGGIAMNMLIPLIKAQRTPLYVSVKGQSGYIFVYIPGADASAGLLKVYVQDAVATNPLLEMADALAIPAGLSGDTIIFEAIYQGME